MTLDDDRDGRQAIQMLQEILSMSEFLTIAILVSVLTGSAATRRIIKRFEHHLFKKPPPAKGQLEESSISVDDD